MAKQKKLHQLIANESDTAKGYDKIKAETFKVFKDRAKLEGFTRTYRPLVDGGTVFPTEEKQMITTVPDRLAWTEQSLIELLDHEFTRDETNTMAKADLVVDGVTLAENVPATYLLVLERRLKEVRAILDDAPTLDMSRKWEPREAGSNVMQAPPEKSFKTERKVVPVVLYDATKEHPAQVKESTKDEIIGEWMKTDFSGAITPDTKAKLLGRCDRLIKAVRDARNAANDEVLIERQIGAKLFEYIHG